MRSPRLLAPTQGWGEAALPHTARAIRDKGAQALLRSELRVFLLAELSSVQVLQLENESSHSFPSACNRAVAVKPSVPPSRTQALQPTPPAQSRSD